MVFLLTIAKITIASFTFVAAEQTILRIRTIDGVVRVPLPNDDPNSSLSSILVAAGVDLDKADIKCQVGLPPGSGGNARTLSAVSPSSPAGQKPATELGLKHGSMITILPPSEAKSGAEHSKRRNNIKANAKRFDPYPDLAKLTSYSEASRRARALSRGAARGTYGGVRSFMHAVDPQTTGPLTRIYVCGKSAARFQNHCIVKNNTARKQPNKKQEESTRVENRVALLFGTTNRERVNQSRKKARTSLSTAREDEKMCEVVKVHAIWEPPMQKPTLNGKHYDDAYLLSNYVGVSDGKETATERAIRVAGWLGLQPLGWIFSYADDNRHEDKDALPVLGRDVFVGAKLQIETMKRRGREEGCKFVTLALDGRTGATEAFQMSDVCVQMAAENVFSSPNSNAEETLPNARYLELNDPVIVSGEETKQLDSVLLLVNTAVLSHDGLYSGGSSASVKGNVKRSSGELLLKTRKRILAALDRKNGVLEELCDFDILMALDSLIGKKENEALCMLVRKYARGMKKGTTLNDHLTLTLQSVL